MSIFGGMGHNRGNECQTCRGSGQLLAVVIDWRERPHRYLPAVKCDVCDGEGRFATAASQGALSILTNRPKEDDEMTGHKGT